MSGELQVVFIYDTKRCRREEDDPREAILYFHPEEIPESRRIAICGQLMGITHFLIDFFAAPKILTLENGKFALRDFGRQFVLALGCSSVTPDWLLEKQADILYNLTRFFHKDIESVLKSVGGDRTVLASKLACIMDHYLPISQHHGDLFALTFGILPILNLPKSASHISLSATVILQTCMLRPGVLGGVVMFQNKVIGVELIQDIAQKLAFIQPYQLPPADAAKPPFGDLPPSVQLLTVYIQNKDLIKLKQHANTYQVPSNNMGNNRKASSNNKEYYDGSSSASNKSTFSTSSSSKIDSIREEEDGVSSSLGFSEPSSVTSDCTNNPPGLDNNTSLTYSSLGTNNSSEGSCSSNKDDETGEFEDSQTFQDSLETDASSSLAGKELMKKFGPVEIPLTCVHTNGCESNFLHPPKSFRSLTKLTSLEDGEGDGGDGGSLGRMKTLSTSLTDPVFPFVRCDGKNISKALLDLHIPGEGGGGVDETNLSEVSEVLETTLRGDIVNVVEEAKKLEGDEVCVELKIDKKTTKNGSKKDKTNLSDCEEALEESVLGKENVPATLNSKPTLGKGGLSRPKDLALNLSSSKNSSKSRRKWSTFEDMMSPLIENPPPLIEVQMTRDGRESYNGKSEMDFIFRKPLSEVEDVGLGDPLIRSRVLNSFRKVSASPEEDIGSGVDSSDLDFNRDNNRRRMSGDTSPEESSKKSTSEAEPKDKKKNCPEEYEKALLFIYSLGGMRLLILIQKEFIGDAELIHSLWDYGSSSLSELEVAVSNVEEQSMSMGHGHHDHYCYLHYEPVWRSLAHGGRNHSMDFDVVQHMHQDFRVYPNINELIIRGEDHVVYGYQCVGSEVFYQQSAGPQPGLPMPSDLMGKVPMKAKRRLERDHNILLL